MAAKALLAANRPEEAEANDRKDLEQYPRNGWSVFGLMQSLEAPGKDAEELRDRFAMQWAQVDDTLSSSAF